MSIKDIIALQSNLISALDAVDADAVIEATRALKDALAALKIDDTPKDAEQLALGLKEAEAARIRVKYLTAWNRQKIERLARFRGQTSSLTYSNSPY